MTAISINAFLGERPAASPRLLEPRMAQIARVAKTATGDLEAYRDLATVTALGADVNTVYAMDIGSGVPKWLHFTDDQLGAGAVEVDVVRGPILGDASERTYLSGLDLPRVSNLAAATTEELPATHAPYVTYPLGVPAPTVAPSLSVQAGDDESTVIAIENPGAENGNTSGWSVEDGDFDVYQSGDVPGLEPHSGTHFFGFGAAAASTVQQAFLMAEFGLAADTNFRLVWWQAGGASTGAMKLRFLDASAASLGEVAAAEIATEPALVWVERSLTAQAPAGTHSVVIEIVSTKVGGGDCDVYLDDIELATVDVSASYDGTSLSDWTVSSRGPTVNSDVGWPVPSFRYALKEGRVAWMHRNMRVENSAAYTVGFDWYTDDSDDIQLSILLGANSSGVSSGLRFAGNYLHLINSTSWDSNSVTVDTLHSVELRGFRIHAELTVERTSASQATLTYTLTAADTNAPLVSGTCELSIAGGYIGFRGQGSGGDNDYGWLDNLTFRISSPPPDNTAARDLLTNYLYTFVNGGGEESAPSPVSRSVQRSDDINIEVTTPTDAPAAYGIVSKNLYRSKTDGSGTNYFLVSTRPLAEATFLDSLDDADLGDLLQSENFDLPPDDLRGLIALPNGVLAGFRQGKNEICVSVQNRPHAWPVAWRLATDFPVVGLAAMDTDLVVATESNPYIVLCSDPSALNAGGGKLEKPQGCVSKRSLVTLDGAGVLYASPDGITAVTRGRVEVITKNLFTREQWQALAPESIHAVVHDGLYWFWYDTGSEQAGYVMDVGSGSLVRLDFYARAAYANPLTDRLYLVVGNDLVEWDAAEALRPYRWRSKLFELGRPTSFEAGIVRCTGDGALTLRLYADRAELPFFEKAITSSQEFLLPDVSCEDTVELELEGVRRVRGAAIAETIEELP